MRWVEVVPPHSNFEKSEGEDLYKLHTTVFCKGDIMYSYIVLSK